MNSASDFCWDDDYKAGQDVNNWYKEKYTGPYLQKAVCRLRAYDRRALEIIRTASGDRVEAAVDLGVGHCVRLRPVLLHVVSEELPYPGDIRPVPPQECCGFERPHTCPVGKIDRVHHDPAVQRIRFLRPDADVVSGVLQDL